MIQTDNTLREFLMLNYYQFMDKYFTPRYMLDILAAREQKA